MNGLMKFEVPMTKMIGKGNYEKELVSTKCVEVQEVVGKGAKKVMQQMARNLAMKTNKGWSSDLDDVTMVDRFEFEPILEEIE